MDGKTKSQDREGTNVNNNLLSSRIFGSFNEEKVVDESEEVDQTSFVQPFDIEESPSALVIKSALKEDDQRNLQNSQPVLNTPASELETNKHRLLRQRTLSPERHAASSFAKNAKFHGSCITLRLGGENSLNNSLSYANQQSVKFGRTQSQGSGARQDSKQVSIELVKAGNSIVKQGVDSCSSIHRDSSSASDNTVKDVIYSR